MLFLPARNLLINPLPFHLFLLPCFTMQPAILLCLLFAVPMVARMNKSDIDYLKWARMKNRQELYEFIAELHAPLKIIHDDFFACKLNASETAAKLLDTLPTFYPKTEVVKYRNLNGLGAMLAGIDAMETVRKCPAKA
ncbi:hypothetical protein PRIPAC_70785 [Pristionchus pacificus]|uniref:Uncharacterized protein n=1 Tax=Pristionchus pacificus TaxID=54126 RepID=A0A2A6C1B8_PRIPA|nr:hypothetical protein PRIPAC_70785 [Pristionchus pacificus]|eukprot:PDM71823.1 hypothetical protein PRIPAC_38230 [Pristionchus pacificus]